MKERPFLIHAMSPLHPGIGQSVDVIDLPIARMRSTGIPILPGSTIKGVLRDVTRRDTEIDQEACWAVFGPDTENASEHAGAITATDARLLALPVRSFRGTFAWVTSPMLLRLAGRDLRRLDIAPADYPDFEGRAARSTANSVNTQNNKVFLEDIDLDVEQDEVVDEWARTLAEYISPDDPEHFTRRFLMVDDETMTFLWETATQIDTRIRLDSETRTVADGALWVEESLPPETLMVGLLSASGSRSSHEMSPDAVLDTALADESVFQFGGSATIGRGRCRMIPMKSMENK